jgi:crossover junction endodeoxyribonuclease RuvC
VDPGTRCAGWAVVGGTAYRPELISCGEIRLSERLALADRLARLHSEIAQVVRQHAPLEAAVEAPFHGVSARSALQLAHARGVVLAALGGSGLPVFEYSPATIKKAVTGNGRAEKQQVEAMVSRLLAGDRTSGRADIADAIAAALCHLFGSGRAEAIRGFGGVRLRR